MALSKAFSALMQTRLQLLKIDLLASQRKITQQTLAAMGLLMATFFLLLSLFLALFLVVPAAYRVYFLLGIALMCLVAMLFMYRRWCAYRIQITDFSDSVVAAVEDLKLMQSAVFDKSDSDRIQDHKEA